jgi:1,2-diacylglycerol 3-alpha-glucosyltransferase
MTHIKTLRDGLQEQGHEVLIVTADKNCKRHYVKDGILHCPALEIKRFCGVEAAAPYSYTRFKLLEDFNPDIIHIHHEFGIGLSGVMAAKLYKKPLVYTLHTAYDQYIYYVAPKIFQKAAATTSHQYMKIIANAANALTGPSDKCGEYFKQIGVKNKDVHLIPNSADLELFDYQKFSDAEKSKLRKKLKINSDEMVVIFAGRIAQEKSIDVLLEYFAEFFTPADKIRLSIVGDGPEKKKLEKLTNTLKIEEMITFTGLVKHNEMPIYYSLSDVFATASLSEMNSISMLEAMASGLMVLQRYDRVNAKQIQSGINGHLFKTGKEAAKHLKQIKKMSKTELKNTKKRVRATVTDRGPGDLAVYMLGVYEEAIVKSKADRDKWHDFFKFGKEDVCKKDEQ